MEDTITAIATSKMGVGSIGIVRISGSDSIKIADKIFKSKNNIPLSERKANTINYGHILDEDRVIDEVLVSIFKAPYSFTAEDVIEINCHGGIFVTKKILELVQKNGARLAEAGEFTKRAFLNGRIDLSKAEAVIDIINAKSELSLKASIEQLNGKISKKINEYRDKILDNIAYMEAAMDDPENILMDDYYETLNEDVKGYYENLSHLKNTFKSGKIIKDGIQTAIIGRPNVGKSSLLNTLSQDEVAIVTDIAGTTRDIIKESITIDGIILNLIDTAGIRNTKDVVESIGVNKALEYIKNAELILYVIDASKSLEKEDLEIIEKIKDKKYICILNKSDLEIKVTKEELENKGIIKDRIINISTKTEVGISEIGDKIKELFLLGDILVNDEVVISNERHREMLEKAITSLENVINAIEVRMSEDLICIDLMDAYAHLGKIIGEEIEDDLADRIFAKFCMGK